MGDDTETTTQTNQTSTKTPWGPASGTLQGILGQVRGIDAGPNRLENAAFRGLLGNYDYMSQFAPQISGLANTLLGGGTDRTGMVQGGMDDYRNQLAGTIEGQYLDPSSNPFFNQVTSRISDDVQNRINAMYAGSGRDPSGAGSYGQNLGRGIAEATAPVFAQQYQQERLNQLGAMNSLYGAGSQSAGLLSQLDQTALGNRSAGVGVAGQAQSAANDPYNQILAVEAQRRGIPLQTLAAQMDIALPIGSAFGTVNTTGTETSTTATPWYQPVIGGAVAGAGLYGAMKK
jgi:hypothetical protein